MSEAYSITVGALSCTAATAKTVIELIAGAGATGKITSVSVSFNDSVAGAAHKVEMVKYATTGTGSAYTPLKYNGEAQNKASVCTAKTSDTVEPATPVVVETYYIPNTAGQFWQLPLGRELYLVSSTLIGIRVTAATTTTAAANLIFEE